MFNRKKFIEERYRRRLHFTWTLLSTLFYPVPTSSVIHAFSPLSNLQPFLDLSYILSFLQLVTNVDSVFSKYDLSSLFFLSYDFFWILVILLFIYSRKHLFIYLFFTGNLLHFHLLSFQRLPNTFSVSNRPCLQCKYYNNQCKTLCKYLQ